VLASWLQAHQVVTTQAREMGADTQHAVDRHAEGMATNLLRAQIQLGPAAGTFHCHQTTRKTCFWTKKCVPVGTRAFCFKKKLAWIWKKKHVYPWVRVLFVSKKNWLLWNIVVETKNKQKLHQLRGKATFFWKKKHVYPWVRVLFFSKKSWLLFERKNMCTAGYSFTLLWILNTLPNPLRAHKRILQTREPGRSTKLCHRDPIEQAFSVA